MTTTISVKRTYNLILIGSSLLFYIFYVIEPPYADWMALGIFIGVIILYFIVQKSLNTELSSNLLSPSNLLLLGLLIVNLQTLLNVMFDFGNLRSYLGKSAHEYLRVPIFYLSLIAINAYLFGIVNYTQHASKRKDRQKMYVIWPWGWLCLFSFIYFLLNIDVVSFMTGMAYKGSGAYDRVREASEFAENLLNVLFTIYLAIYAYNNVVKFNKIGKKDFLKGISVIFWIPFFIYIALRAMSGDRGPVIYNVLLIFFAYFISARPNIRTLWVILMVIGGAFTVTVMGIARGLATDKSFGKKMSEAMEMTSESKPSIFSPTQELANSINCNFIAVYDIDKGKTEYRYGANTFYNISTAIPGSYSIYKNILDIDPKKYSTSEYLTISQDGELYRFGLGMSAFSEFYLDGGIWGLIIGFFFLGVLFRYVDKVIMFPTRYSILSVIFSLKLASICIYLARSSMGYGISKGLYCVIIFLIFNFIFSKKYRLHSKINKPTLVLSK